MNSVSMHLAAENRSTFSFALPSPESLGLVGEGDGRFPLGGLSDIPDSLERARKRSGFLALPLLDTLQTDSKGLI